MLFGGGTRRDEEFAVHARRVEESIAEPSPPSSTCPAWPEDERMLLAYGIVGLAEGTSRHWLRSHGPGDRRARRSVAELAWAGLRGINAG